MGARPPKLVNSAKYIKSGVGDSEPFRKRMIKICTAVKKAVKLRKLGFYIVVYNKIPPSNKIRPIIIV